MLKFHLHLLACLSIFCIVVTPNTIIGADNLYNQIRGEILSNCYDCFGGSEQALRAAVQRLSELVESGFELTEAQMLLADSYHQIAVVYAPQNSQESEDLLERHKQIYTDLMETEPNNTEIFIRYARTGRSAESAEVARNNLQELLAEMNYISGTSLRRSSDTAERALGLERLQEAFRLATGVMKINYGMKLANELRSSNLMDQAIEIEEEVQIYSEEIGL